jgi:hypothetical protein
MWQSTNVYFICAFAAIGKAEPFFRSFHVFGTCLVQLNL